MKRFTTLFVLVYILTNIAIKTPVLAVNVFREGGYKISDFNFSPTNMYNIQNISPSNGVVVAVFDKNQVLLQTMILDPKFKRYNLLPLNPLMIEL